MLHPFALNLFPELLTWSFFAPLVVRVAGGFIAVSFGRRARPTSMILGAAYAVTGTLLIIGLYTQAVALACMATALFESYARRNTLSAADSDLRFLLIAACVSLLLSGAGALALDLPL